ncbi:putative transmembrane anti-sigma factor [Alicyclobacillus hesperidum URH17-3-68]|nr:putative transmembrane anti-sigma factor [Alicyclobacillus hesperidum URH17-3-68]
MELFCQALASACSGQVIDEGQRKPGSDTHNSAFVFLTLVLAVAQ